LIDPELPYRSFNLTHMEPTIHTPDAEGFIPYIHNYCDRWCEQCRFVDRCRVGYEELDPERGGFKERTQEETFQQVAANMQKTMEMLEQMMRERGIDPDEVRREMAAEKPEDPRKARKQEVRGHPLSVLSHGYAMDMIGWTEDHEEVLKATYHLLARKAEMNVDPEGQLAAAERLNNALELLSRYGMPIGSKTDRALMGKAEGFDEWDEEHPYQDDANGSAKVARILMERSLAAWGEVLEIAPELTDAALPLMAQLKKAHGLLLEEFPHTDRFIRPGFDDPQGA
jgi:hypothetical protein